MSNFDLLKRYAAEIEVLPRTPGRASRLDAQTLLLLIGALQLALRHPTYSPPPAGGWCSGSSRTSVSKLRPQGGRHHLRGHVNRGFNPVYDEAP